MTPPRFTVHHSGLARDLLVAAVRAAAAAGRRAEVVAAALAIERWLTCFADGFGESRGRLKVLGELRFAAILPVTV